MLPLPLLLPLLLKLERSPALGHHPWWHYHPAAIPPVNSISAAILPGSTQSPPSALPPGDAGGGTAPPPPLVAQAPSVFSNLKSKCSPKFPNFPKNDGATLTLPHGACGAISGLFPHRGSSSGASLPPSLTFQSPRSCPEGGLSRGPEGPLDRPPDGRKAS